MSIEFEWVSSQETRNELADVIEGNLAEFEFACSAHYVEDYPHSRANDLPTAVAINWTNSTLLALCEMLRNGELSEMFLFATLSGDLYEDPHEVEFSKFVNSIGGPLSFSRNMAGVLNRFYIQDGIKARRMIVCLEEVCKFIIASNMNAYWASLATPGSLSAHWRVYERVAESSESDLSAPTPRERFADRAGLRASAEEAPGSPVDRSADRDPLVSSLSRREQEVLRLLMEGKTNNEICYELDLKLSTVKSYVSRIFDKYNVNSRAELLSKVLQRAN